MHALQVRMLCLLCYTFIDLQKLAGEETNRIPVHLKHGLTSGPLTCLLTHLVCYIGMHLMEKQLDLSLWTVYCSISHMHAPSQ